MDGDADSRAAVTATLQRAGFEVREAPARAEAFRLTADPLDLILLGHLPDLTAREFCRRLKSDPATQAIPVILVEPLRTQSHLPRISRKEPLQCQTSGFRRDRHGRRAARPDADEPDAHLDAPVEPRALVTVVKALLRALRAETAASCSSRSVAGRVRRDEPAACLLDSEGKTVRCNQAHGGAAARDAEEVVGHPFHALAEAVLGPLQLPSAARIPRRDGAS